ncbi:hypothetical protein [Anabaena sp. CCY 9402-a]|uniref:hypothetical protein n=1 Tax=Anabaena sp. CCY 9402-a TaxID=3103867 RepID=UPI0039C5CD31
MTRLGIGHWALQLVPLLCFSQSPVTCHPSGSPVAHGGNPQDRAGSPVTCHLSPVTYSLL